jgi:hypothetical protein
MEEIRLVAVVGRDARARLFRTEMVDGQPVRVAYSIQFVLGRDGLWYIESF